MRRLVIPLLFLAGCQAALPGSTLVAQAIGKYPFASPPMARPKLSILRLPPCGSVQDFAFTNHGPETALLQVPAPCAWQGAMVVPAGRTVHVIWTDRGYAAELVP